MFTMMTHDQADDVEAECLPVVQSLVAVLDQLAELLTHTTDEQYSLKPGGPVTSSIGGHLRHNLDHIVALLRSRVTGELNYDHRERGTDIELNRTAALSAIRALTEELLDTDWQTGPDTLTISLLVTPDAPPLETTTTIERELAFVLSHTIHHNALIAIMAKLLGIAVPVTFGYAPSTLAYQRSRTCVR